MNNDDLASIVKINFWSHHIFWQDCNWYNTGLVLDDALQSRTKHL